MPFLIAILSLVVLYFVFGFVVFFKAFHRKKDLDWLNAKALENTPWKDFANDIPLYYKWLEDNGAKDVSLTTFDGLKLKGKFVKCENARGSIILMHGFKGNFASDYGIVFDAYKSIGLNILAFRQRSHGESEGKYITFGAKEHKDLLEIIKYHNETYGEIPLFISGLSMGASTVLYASNKDLPKNVKALSADCGFTSPYEIVLKVVNETLKFNAKFVMPAVNFWCKLIADFDIKEFNSTEILKTAKRPILFIHGTEDELVPVEMTKRNYEACTSEKELVLVEGAGHGLSYVLEPERVKDAFTNFYEKHLND